jgi:hypothetical protein
MLTAGGKEHHSGARIFWNAPIVNGPAAHGYRLSRRNGRLTNVHSTGPTAPEHHGLRNETEQDRTGQYAQVSCRQTDW